MTAAERARRIAAMVDELVAAGFSREDADRHVRETTVHEFDVIEVDPATLRRSARPTSPRTSR